MTMRLVVGLGNPGQGYSRTRHNMGFAVIARLGEQLRSRPPRRIQQSLVAEVQWAGMKLVLAQPLTYMNLSGKAVAGLLAAYRLPLEQLLVVCDDIDLPLGSLRLRGQGGAGGHRGLESIIEMLQSKQFARLRIGVGKPAGGKKEVRDFVLDTFTEEELPFVAWAEEQSARGVLIWAKRGLPTAMNEVNTWKPPDPGGEETGGD